MMVWDNNPALSKDITKYYFRETSSMPKNFEVICWEHESTVWNLFIWFGDLTVQ